MMVLRIGRRCLTAGLVVLLAACGGQSLTQGSLPGVSSGAQPGVVALGHNGSKQDLLYISSIENSNPNVFVYTYPKGRLKTKVDKSALTFPHGECADRRGHVYVTNESSNPSSTAILEYAHGGIEPIRTLTVNDSADQCSVDPTTGNLAVVSRQLAIFRAARGTPTYYPFPAGFERSACDYDNKGNLFVNGVTRRDPSHAALIELPAGGSTFARIKMPPISDSGSRGEVRWDGKDLALGDGINSIFILKISETTARNVGIAQLYGGAEVESMWIQSGDIVGANFANRSVMIWAYPAGGQPFKVLNSVGRGDGVAVSLAPK
jgi:hypothetical protein